VPTPAAKPFRGKSWIDYWRMVEALGRDSEPDAATMVKKLTQAPVKPRPEGGPLGSETFSPYYSGADTSFGFVSYILFGGFQRNSDCTLSQVLAGQNSSTYTYSLVQTIPNFEKYLHTISGMTTTVDKFPNGCKDPNTIGQMVNIVSAGKTKSGDYIGAGFNINGGSIVNVRTMTPSLAIATSVDYNVGYNVSGLLVADFNGDGYLDIAAVDTATADYSTGQISILLANGDGTFKAPIQISNPTGVYGMVAGDFNGDGKVDLVVTSQKANQGDFELLYFAGLGTGNFKTAVATDTGKTELLVSTPADVNGDGKIDIMGWSIATSGNYAATLDAMLGNGSGGFTSTLSVVSPGSYSPMTVGDLNGDGKLDVVFGDAEGNAIVVTQGDGTGKFTQKGYYPSVYSADSVYITDFDGDGNNDILVGIASEGFFGPVAAGGGLGEVLLGKGNFTFSQPAALLPQVSGVKLANGPSSLAVADLNGDSKQDVAAVGATNASPGLVTVETWTNGGGGALTAGTPVNFSILGGGFEAPGIVVATPLSGTSPIDLVVAGLQSSGNNEGAIQTAINGGTGTFTVKSTVLNVAAPVAALAAGDFNADAKGDLAFIMNDGNSDATDALYIALGNGDGTFKTPTILDTTMNSGGLVFVADVNNDGKPDIVAVQGAQDFGASTVRVYLNQGTTFAAPKTFQTPDSASVSDVIVADLNGDGKIDLGVIGFNESAFETNLYLYTGSNSATFTYASTTNLGPQGASTGIAADVNQDGLVDIVVDGCCGLATPSVLLGSGKGAFYPPQPFLSPQSVNGLKAISLTGSKYPDLIMDVDSNYNESATILPVLNHYANAGTTTKAATQITIGAIGTLSQGEYASPLVTVSERSAAGQPTGTITISYNGRVLQTLPLGSGEAYFYFPTTAFAPGTYTLTVDYGGDNFNEPSTATVSMKIIYATAITFTVTPNPIPNASNVTLKATVARNPGSGYPTGSVTFFYDGGNAILGTVPLKSGVATLTSPSTAYPAGTYVLQAGYYGDTDDGDALSDLITVVLVPKGKDGTTTAVTLSPNPITSGQTATVSATVLQATGTSAGTPTGTMTFTITSGGQSIPLGTVKLDSSGKASVSASTSSLYAGYTYTINAVYSGNSTFYTSQGSIPLTLRSPTFVNLYVSPQSVTEGQTVTLTGVVPQLTNNPPTGTITFEANGVALTTVKMSGGKAVFPASTAGINPGTYSVTAVYSGDQYNGASTSQPLAVTVTK
jgi:hypothetical protein